MKKEKILPKFIIILLVLLFGNVNIFSQSISPQSIVDLSFTHTIKKTAEGKKINIDIILNIKKSWHINANKLPEESLMPTVIRFDKSEDFAIQKIIYPPAKMVKLPFSNSELALYETQAKIKAVLLVDKKLRDKKLNVTGKLQYQPCNDQTCLFPVSKPFSISVNLK